MILLGLVGFIIARLGIDECYDRKERVFKKGGFVCNYLKIGIVLIFASALMLYYTISDMLK